jgi:hypothetical protein
MKWFQSDLRAPTKNCYNGLCPMFGSSGMENRYPAIKDFEWIEI